MVYSLRNLLIAYAIVVIGVVLIVSHTFSSVRLQEKGMLSIQRSREVMQKLGPALVNMEEFQSMRVNHGGITDERLTADYNKALEKLKNDSAGIAGLALTNKGSASSYLQLTQLIHQAMEEFHSQNPVDREIQIMKDFKSRVNSLEDEQRQNLNRSYNESIRLSKETFAFVRIICILLSLIIIACFVFNYRDINSRKRTELQLKRFNVELEKQVEEKTKLIKDAESMFRHLVEQSLVGVYILVENKLVYGNPRFAEIFGYEQSELTGSILSERLVHPDDMEKFRENLRLRLSGERGSVNYELRCLKKNQETIEVEVFGSRTEYQGKVAVIGTLLDITERRKAERENEHMSRLLKERVKELSTLYQLGQIFQNEKRSLNDILRDAVVILPQGWQYPEIAAAKIVVGGVEYKTHNYGPAVHSQTATFKDPGGELCTVEVIYLQKCEPETEDAFFIEERNMINMVAEMLRIHLFRQHEAEMNKRMQREILDRKVQEQKTVMRAILNAEERERNKIGQELHDNINQILASIKMYLGMAKAGGEKNVKDIISESSSLLDHAIQEIRELSKSQVTPLKKIDLKELIQALVDKLNEGTDITTEFICNINDKPVEDDLKLNIYRIVQEQINNILKHAEASVISIVLEAGASELHLSITDDGKGFDPGQQRKGIGISNMINRVELFNGELNITSSPGKGCKIDIRIPC